MGRFESEAIDDMRVEECKTCSLYAHLHNLVIRSESEKSGNYS